jgi:hypothetical protein
VQIRTRGVPEQTTNTHFYLQTFPVDLTQRLPQRRKGQTASNYAHATAGRAHDSGGYALANGSNQNMGLNNIFYTTTLAQTSAGYYVIGSCP